MSAPTSAAELPVSGKSINGEREPRDASIRPLIGRAKLHGRHFYESIGAPRLILAPMVDQSEFVS